MPESDPSPKTDTFAFVRRYHDGMTFRWIAIWASVGVMVLTALDVIVVGRLDAHASFWYYAVVRTALFALVAVCAAATANKFRWWSEYGGRAWTLFLVAYSLLACSEIARRFFPAH